MQWNTFIPLAFTHHPGHVAINPTTAIPSFSSIWLHK